MSKSRILLFLVLAVVGCSDDTDDDDNDDESSEMCTTFCERVLGCYETEQQASASAWLVAGDLAYCEQRCTAGNSVDMQCVECLADLLACQTTGPMRPCDPDCEPTEYVTGEDDEGAPLYDYWTYYSN